MGSEGVGSHRLGAEGQIFQVGDARQALVHLCHHGGRVLALHVGARVYALVGYVRVQLEGSIPPAHLGGGVAQQAQCYSPALHADIAPWSDDVGPDHDIDHGFSLCSATTGALTIPEAYDRKPEGVAKA